MSGGTEYLDRVRLGDGAARSDIEPAGAGALTIALITIHEPAAVDPVAPAPVAGDLYYNTATNSWRRYNGAAWDRFVASGVASDDAAAGNSNDATFTTGDAAAGDSGSLLFTTGSASGTRGSVILDGQAIQLDVGGNARGLDSLDFQGTRSAATQVASGTRSSILSGSNNTVAGDDSVASGLNNAIGASSVGCSIFGSSGSITQGANSSILASGTDGAAYVHTIDDTGAYVGRNLIAGCYGIGADICAISGSYASSIISSYSCTMTGGYNSSIIGCDGLAITAGSYWSTGLAANGGTISGSRSSAIMASASSTVTGADRAAVVAGNNCAITADGALVTGRSGLGDHPAAFVFSGNATASVAEQGRSQGEMVHLDGQIAGSSTTEMVAGSTTGIAVPANTTLAIQGSVTSFNLTTGKVACWFINALVANDSGTTTLVGARPAAQETAAAAVIAVEGYNNEGASAANIGITLIGNDANDRFDIQVATNIAGAETDTRRFSAALRVTRAAGTP